MQSMPSFHTNSSINVLINFLLLVFVWQHNIFSHYRLLWAAISFSSSHLWALTCVEWDASNSSIYFLPTVGFCVAAARHLLMLWMLGNVGKDLIWMCVNDEVLELSGKRWEWMGIKCYIKNGNG